MPPRYTYRPTSTNPRDKPDDKTVEYDKQIIGRTYLVDGGPRGAQWYWSAFISGGVSLGSDYADTMEEALEEVKRAHQAHVGS